MKTDIKKISIVVYCNGNFEETKETLYSLIDQHVSNIYFEVLILNDNANKKFTDKLNKFIKEQDLVNYHLFSFAFYTGLPLTFNFLVKNNIIKSPYTTIVKSGDIVFDGWINHFIDNLYSLKCDLYMSDLKDWLYVPKNILKEGKEYDISKSRMIITPSPSGLLSINEAITTKPIFLGKIWKTSILQNLRLDNDRILYQDIFTYFQLLLGCDLIWYENKYSGIVKRKSWLPEQMDKKRIELLSLTLNKMVSRNPYMNGQVLQLLAMALNRTPEADRKQYLISNFKYLRNNFEIQPLYDLSKRKVIKLTKPFVQVGEVRQK